MEDSTPLPSPTQDMDISSPDTYTEDFEWLPTQSLEDLDDVHSKRYIDESTQEMNQDHIVAELNMKDSENTIADDYDSSPDFTTKEEFADKDALVTWAQTRGRELNMVLVCMRSNLPKNRAQRIWIACERHGKYRKNKEKINDLENEAMGSKRKISPEGETDRDKDKEKVKVLVRKTGTKKCNCPFLLRGFSNTSNGTWRVSVSCGVDNHPLGNYLVGHSYVGRLTPQEKELFVDLSKGGVKPKVALGIIKERDPNNATTLQTLYNVKKQIRTEELEERSTMQQLMKVCCDYDYIVHDRRDSEDIVHSLFWANTNSISLAKSFPYIFIMDSTYNTNIHDYPLFQIVGITSTQKTFSVCYTLMKEENSASFVWALKLFIELLNGAMPVTVVTDRCLALMLALEEVLPEANKLLCRWHIGMAVKHKSRTEIPLGDGNDDTEREKFASIWSDVVYSDNESEYEGQWALLKLHFGTYPKLLKYLEDQWLRPYKEKFVQLWTDKWLHFGNTSTNRVESAHAMLKKDLMGLRRYTFLGMFLLIHRSIGTQLSEIKATFEKSLNSISHEHRIHFFDDIRGSVSKYALDLLKIELDGCEGVGVDEMLCGCRLRRTHGLPCAHEINLIRTFRGNKKLQLHDLHPFWKKLTATPHNVDIDDLEMHEEFAMLAARYRQADLVGKRFILRRLKDISRPHTTWLREPVMRRTSTRGRSRRGKSSSWTNRRVPSSFEKPINTQPNTEIPTKVSQPKKSTSKGKVTVQSQDQYNTSRIFQRYITYVPECFRPFVVDIESPVGDGNCGYRAVALAMGRSQEMWQEIREDFVEEINTHFDMYSVMLGGDECVESYKRMADWHGVGIAPKKKWMVMPLSGFFISNIYNYVLVYLIGDRIATFLPQHSTPPAPGQYDVMCIMNVVDDDHYAALKLAPFCPIAKPIGLWNPFAQGNSVGWYDLIKVRVEAFNQLIGSKLEVDDITEIVPICLTDSDADDKDECGIDCHTQQLLDFQTTLNVP